MIFVTLAVSYVLSTLGAAATAAYAVLVLVLRVTGSRTLASANAVTGASPRVMRRLSSA